ncbi:MAG: segregation/condensation protein A [Nitrospirae bacterium]|nr:segregation/condensation protein A [Nitrospirota bacterium]
MESLKSDFRITETEYILKLPVFEGPLDLLLSLIRKSKVDIYDIPISFITGEYLRYLEIMEELNLDTTGEFLLMAATLIQIKSTMLLPVEQQDGQQEEDPRLELVERLLQYQSFKESAYLLREREVQWEDVFFKDPSAAEEPPYIDPEDGAGQDTEPCLFNVNLYDLLEALRSVMEKKPAERKYITKETLTIKSKIAIIVQHLEEEEEIDFMQIFEDDVTKMDFIVTFLALLEMLRLGIAIACQHRDFGSIRIRKRIYEK